MKRTRYYLGLSLLGAGIFSSSLGQSPGITNEDLLKRIQELEEQVKILAGKGATAQGSPAPENTKPSVSVSAGASGFQIQSADTNFVLKIRGYLQADSRWFFNDEGPSSPSNDTFLMRRVRPILEGTLYDKFDYRLMLDFGSGVTANSANDAYLQDAYVNAKLWPQLQIQAGKFKEPIGLERLQSGANLLFVERAYPSQILPSRDVGVQLQGEFGDGLFQYAAGVFNGVSDGGSGDIDRSDDEKDFAGRIFSHPFKNSDIRLLQGLGIGIAGSYGNQTGALRSYSTPGQQNFFSYYSGTGTNALTQADGSQWRLSPQAYWYWRSLGIIGEYAISSPEVVRTGGATGRTTASLQHTAWQVAASYFITGEENSFKTVTPLKPFKLGESGWGALELAARVSGLKLDEDTFPNFANPSTSASEAFSYTLGLNWHLNRNVKVYLNYEHTDFEGGESNPLLTNGENVILTRAQLSF